MNTETQATGAMQMFCQQESIKSNIRIYEDNLKQQNRSKIQLETAQQKILMREHEKEMAKAQREEMEILENGSVSVVTKNLKIDAEMRYVTNFLFPEIAVLCRISKPMEKAYLFVCNIGKEEKYVLLAADNCGKPSYLLRKLGSIGGEIRAASLSEQKVYASQLWRLLICKSKKTLWLPDRRGWYIDESGKVQFFRGKWSWEEVKECVK